MTNKSNFTAATGTYYVMTYLSRECIHAACTTGNAPFVDVLDSSIDGNSSTTIQVKTAKYARRNKRKINERSSWHFKYDVAKEESKPHFYALVDLTGEDCEGKEHWIPTVYIIPSSVISEQCKLQGWSDKSFILDLSKTLLEQYKNNWTPLKQALSPSVTNIWGD